VVAVVDANFLANLLCPYCAGKFSCTEVAPGFGILICYCDRFPVIDGIPLIRRSYAGCFARQPGKPWSPSAMKRELLALLEWGRTREALRRCLAFPAATPRLSALMGGRLAHTRLMRALQFRLCRIRFNRLMARRDSLTSADVLKFFDDPNSPLGPHIERRMSAARAIGCDGNFVLLWIMRHWMEPPAELICCDLTEGLPFAAPNKRAPADQMRRRPFGPSCALSVSVARDPVQRVRFCEPRLR
jgi:hypothetical protein